MVWGIWCVVVMVRRERRGATLLFGVTRPHSAWAVNYVILRHLCTVAKASATGLGAPSIYDPAAGQQRGALAPPCAFNFQETFENNLYCLWVSWSSIMRHVKLPRALHANLPLQSIAETEHYALLGTIRWMCLRPILARWPAGFRFVPLHDQHETPQAQRRARPWSGWRSIGGRDHWRSMRSSSFPCFQPQFHRACKNALALLRRHLRHQSHQQGPNIGLRNSSEYLTASLSLQHGGAYAADTAVTKQRELFTRGRVAHRCTFSVRTSTAVACRCTSLQ